MELKLITHYIMAFLYTAVGISHFLRPKFYLRIVPPFLPMRLTLVYLSGVAEIILGIALVLEATRSLAECHSD